MTLKDADVRIGVMSASVGQTTLPSNIGTRKRKVRRMTFNRSIESLDQEVMERAAYIARLRQEVRAQEAEVWALQRLIKAKLVRSVEEPHASMD